MILHYRWLIFYAFAFLVLFLLFMPDIFPRCSCCGKLKLRPFIRIHRAVSISPGYGGSRSVCTRCCREYQITSIQDLDRLIGIRRKLRMEMLSMDDILSETQVLSKDRLKT